MTSSAASPGLKPFKEFDNTLKSIFVKVEQEHPYAPLEFKDPYSTCTFIALKDYDQLRAGHVYHVQDHAARNGDSWKIQFENNEIGYLQASKIVQVIKEG